MFKDSAILSQGLDVTPQKNNRRYQSLELDIYLSDITADRLRFVALNASTAEEQASGA